LKSNQDSSYRIILADDHPLFRTGLAKLITEYNGFKVVAEAGNGEELLQKLKKHSCDLVITDLSMPKMNGLEAVARIRKDYPDIQVMVLSMHQEPEYFRKVLASGVQGYLLKDDVYEDLISAIKTIRQGRKVYSRKLSNMIVEDYAIRQESELSLELLTKREKGVLVLIAEGNSNKDIAHTLEISVRTVEAHRAHIMEKLKIKNVQGLVKFAMNHGLI
jgi:two-component system response regulator NreC